MNGENLAKILLDVSNIAFVIAAGWAVLAIIIFFKCRIPTVFGDLSGRNARKSIQKVKETTEPLSTGVPFRNIEKVIVVHTDETIV